MIEVKRKEADITAEELKIRQLKANLKNYDSWDYKHYPLTKREAEVVLEIFREHQEMIEKAGD